MLESKTFLPDWVTPPGSTISDILEENGRSVYDFAAALGDPPEMIERILSGKLRIDSEIAKKLEIELGVPMTFWLEREAQYRRDFDRLQSAVSHEDIEWLSILPISEMSKLNWIPSTSSMESRIRACKAFFNVPTAFAWKNQFARGVALANLRTTTTYDSTLGAVAAWLRRGEIESESIDCGSWDAVSFRASLTKIRELTRQKDPKVFLPKLQKICAESGVAVVIAKTPTGCRASGATKFLSPSKALLMLSMRYLSDDHFWFTFFHEAGHLLLHGESTTFLETTERSTEKKEIEANNFSSQQLIPSELRSEMERLPAEIRPVMRFAKKVGISPGIVVGQLQHAGLLKRHQLNRLKARYKWQ